MPRIKNWKRIHDGSGKITWKHRQEPDAYVIAEDKTESVEDGRTSHWAVYLYNDEDPVHKITDFEAQKNEARTAAADWMRDHPHLSDDILESDPEDEEEEETLADLREKARKHNLIPRDVEEPYWEIMRRDIPGLDTVRPVTVTPDDDLPLKALALYSTSEEATDEVIDICEDFGMQELKREEREYCEKIFMVMR